MVAIKHLPSIVERFYCPQAFLSLDFQCENDFCGFAIEGSGLESVIGGTAQFAKVVAQYDGLFNGTIA